jgi:hypothetical protein
VFSIIKYIKISESGNDLFLLVEINTTENYVVRNVNVFSFASSGKIKSIEVFFGAGSKYPGNTEYQERLRIRPFEYRLNNSSLYKFISK